MASRTQFFTSKPRVFILSDISNEPDDAESLVRYLLYSNQFITEGLVAVTSTWMKNKVCPEDMNKILDAYDGVVANLNVHAHPSNPYPSANYLRSLVKPGAPVYGFAAVGDNVPLSPGGELLLERIIAPSTEPLWILVWGGTNVLASVLSRLESTRSADDFASLRSKLRIYTISDQDPTGPWIRTRWPDLFYIASVHAWNSYGLAVWTGIAGDKYYGFDRGGPDFSKVEKGWIKDNIQIGPLGAVYPDYMFIPEGDTPTFLYLVQNGLGVRERPDWGSWGGRYALIQGPQAAEGHAGRLGSASRHYSDTADVVVGKDGNVHRSNQATVWRWRDSFQNDFAARIRWSMESDFAAANHHPVVGVNGIFGQAPVEIEAEAGTEVIVDASSTYDPDSDGSGLTFKWWHYREPTATQWATDFEVAELRIEKVNIQGSVVKVHLPGPEKCAVDLFSRRPLEKGQLMHLILEVTDTGTLPLTSYRRILIQTMNMELRGGGGVGGDTIADVMKDVKSYAEPSDSMGQTVCIKG